MLHNQVEIKGRIIDHDYTGNIQSILHNFGPTSFDAKESNHLAQLILEQYFTLIELNTKTMKLINQLLLIACTHYTICVIPLESTNIHPDTGLPQLNFNQFQSVSTSSIMALTNFNKQMREPIRTGC